MVSKSVVRNIFGIIGNVTAGVLFLSPVPTLTTIYRSGEVEQFSPIPFLATLLNCMLWVFYGLPFMHCHSTLILTINCIGVFLEAIYLTFFFVYAAQQGRLLMLKVLFVEAVFMMAVILGVLLGAETREKRELIVGIFCAIFGICMYAAPLSVMRLVIQTRSVQYMPLYLSLASFANAACWTTYGLLDFDIFTVLPNGLGALLAAAQLIIYAWYRTPAEDEGGGNISSWLAGTESVALELVNANA